MSADLQALWIDNTHKVLARLKKAADNMEPVQLNPSEAMLLFRSLTEGAGFPFDGRDAADYVAFP